MPEKTSQLTPLALRKELLRMESDLNRAKMIEAAQDWKVQFESSKQQVMSYFSIASVAAKVARFFFQAARGPDRKSGGSKSWILPMLFDGLRTGTNIWNLFRSRRQSDKD